MHESGAGLLFLGSKPLVSRSCCCSPDCVVRVLPTSLALQAEDMFVRRYSCQIIVRCFMRTISLILIVVTYLIDFMIRLIMR